MVWVVVVVVVVAGAVLPAVGWWLTRKPPPLDATGRRPGEFERWLADQYGLGWRDCTRVSQAVLGGRPVSDPALEAPARGFAAQVTAGRFRTLRLYRKMGWSKLILGFIYIVGAIVAPVFTHGGAGWLLAAFGLLYGGLQIWIGTYNAYRRPNRIRRNAELSLHSSQIGDFR